MKIVTLAVAGALVAALPTAASSQTVPLSESAIDNATFSDWQSRQETAEEVADTARADQTIPPVEPSSTSGEEGANGAGAAGADQASNAQSGNDASASSDAPKVPVTGEANAVVASPEESTDVPDEAGLETVDEPKAPDPFMVRLQVLLDRAHASPGVIDGFMGNNTRKALSALETMRKLPVDGEIDQDVWNALKADSGKVMKTYTITEDDVSGRYVDSIPEDYAKLAKMKWLGFHGPAEMLAERFHMDQELLKTLNPQADFQKPGTKILVADLGKEPETPVERIVVDKGKGELVAYDASGTIVSSYPATIGSQDTPSPAGEVTVKSVTQDPHYIYNPEKNFQQGDNTQKLDIHPGPNGPVGSVWIALSKPTYGIHGTSEPSLISTTQSHGCVRLTNWDAEALSHLVEPQKTVVEFKG